MGETGEVAFSLPFIGFTVVVVVCTWLIVKWLNKSTNKNQKELSKQKEALNSGYLKNDQNLRQQKKKTASTQKLHTTATSKFEHPHLLATLKGHTGLLTGGDFSPSGKHFITASQDRSILIWNTKDFTNKNRKSSRGNIDYDHAQHICWSPDSKAFIIYKAVGNVIEVYKMNRKSNGTFGDIKKAITFPEKDRNSVVIALDVAVNGRFIMTCDDKNQLILWDLRGGVLEKFDTRHGDTYSAQISPCGRFVATTGFTPDAKVWEVHFNKNGSYENVKRAFDLKGHSSGIFSCSFNSDSSKMVTVSKDATWRLYNTQVEYSKGQEPYFILSATYTKKPEASAMILLSPDGRTVAVATGPDLSCYSAIDGAVLYTIKNIYTESVIQIKFDPANKYIITLGDKHVIVFHNVAGYHTLIQDLKRSRTKATTAGMRERIDVQIKDAETTLASMNF